MNNVYSGKKLIVPLFKGRKECLLNMFIQEEINSVYSGKKFSDQMNSA